MKQDNKNEVRKDAQHTDARMMDMSFECNDPLLCVTIAKLLADFQLMDVLHKSTLTSENIESRCEAIEKAIEEILTA